MTVPTGARTGSEGLLPENASCEWLAFSPAFAHDESAFCAGPFRRDSALEFGFFVSKDGGSSWSRPAAAGMRFGTTNNLIGQLTVSPLYEQDRTVFVTTSDGLWRTTDDGENFELINDIVRPIPDALSEYTETTGLPGIQPEGPHVAFAYANGALSAKVDPPLHLPIAGSPEEDVRFVVPPTFDEDGRALAFSRLQGADGVYRIRLYGCTREFACGEPLFEFPSGYFVKAWFSSDYSESGTMFVQMTRPLGELEDKGEFMLWRSDDFGRTFKPWTSVNRLLTEVAAGGGSHLTSFWMAPHPLRPNEMYVRITFSPKDKQQVPPAPPAHRLLRSTDGGETWKLVAYGLDIRQRSNRSKRPSLQWNVYGPAFISFQANGKLFALGNRFGVDSYSGPYCSVDRGKTWTQLCP
ncbi:MAG: hypothetical protein ACRDLB_00915 [Actinomycetota bacterium]